MAEDTYFDWILRLVAPQTAEAKIFAEDPASQAVLDAANQPAPTLTRQVPGREMRRGQPWTTTHTTPVEGTAGSFVPNPAARMMEQRIMQEAERRPETVMMRRVEPIQQGQPLPYRAAYESPTRMQPNPRIELGDFGYREQVTLPLTPFRGPKGQPLVAGGTTQQGMTTLGGMAQQPGHRLHQNNMAHELLHFLIHQEFPHGLAAPGSVASMFATRRLPPALAGKAPSEVDTGWHMLIGYLLGSLTPQSPEQWAATPYNRDFLAGMNANERAVLPAILQRLFPPTHGEATPPPPPRPPWWQRWMPGAGR